PRMSPACHARESASAQRALRRPAGSRLRPGPGSPGLAADLLRGRVPFLVDQDLPRRAEPLALEVLVRDLDVRLDLREQEVLPVPPLGIEQDDPGRQQVLL